MSVAGMYWNGDSGCSESYHSGGKEYNKVEIQYQPTGNEQPEQPICLLCLKDGLKLERDFIC